MNVDPGKWSTGEPMYIGDPTPPMKPIAPKPWYPIQTTVKTVSTTGEPVVLKNPKAVCTTKHTQEIVDHGDLLDTWTTEVRFGSVTLVFDDEGGFVSFYNVIKDHVQTVKAAQGSR